MNKTDIEIDDVRQELLAQEGHILVEGGPGSGKTTAALLKASERASRLLPGQHVLVLSFARRTVIEIENRASTLVDATVRKLVEVNTYHGFFWSVLRSHSYLLRQDRLVKFLTPPEAAILFAGVKPANKRTEVRSHFERTGALHFDVFAEKTSELFSRSASLLRIISDSYPVVIVDEFQDTNAEEWDVIKLLGTRCQVIALADHRQRIYDFRGADPNRIGEFIHHFQPARFDFGEENRRSSGRDIVDFGNDLVAGRNHGTTYGDVEVLQYPPRRNGNHSYLKQLVIKARRRAWKLRPDDWSVAVLVPTNKLMLEVSSYLTAKQNTLPPVRHRVAIDAEGPSLAALFVARLLEGAQTSEFKSEIVNDICNHILGRRGEKKPVPTSDQKLVEALRGFTESGKIRGKTRQALVSEIDDVLARRQALELDGDPGKDWVLVRRLLEAAEHPMLRRLYDDALFVRLMKQGGLLRSRLSTLWRDQHGYGGALQAVNDALREEQLLGSREQWQGLSVMTIHKSKGKEFDEVIVYEGVFAGRFASSTSDHQRDRRTLRVAVTRAREHCTILTPKRDPCQLL